MDWLELSPRKPPQLSKIFAALPIGYDSVRGQEDRA
jgi:hypothetical protein